MLREWVEMYWGTGIKVGCAPLILFTIALTSCAEAKPPSKPSLLGGLPGITPVIACIDAAPLNDEAALKACVKPTGLPFNRVEHDPRSLDDFKSSVILFWLATNRGPDRIKNTALFIEAIDYARCVENAAYSDEQFASRNRKGVEAARARSQLACKDHRLFLYRADPTSRTTPANIMGIMFAKSLANLAFNYALEANGWFPDEMRPCIRYADGRPPSAACADKGPTVAPPPPR